MPIYLKWAMCGVLLLGTGLTGCSRTSDPEQTTDKQTSSERGTMRTLVEGVTGKQALEQGRKTQQKIRDISEDRDQQLQDILEDE